TALFYCFLSFYFTDTSTTHTYTLSLHDALPISLGNAVVADVARIAQPVRLLSALARERVVADHDPVAGHARHLLHGGEHVGKVVRRDAAGHRVEAPVGEREMVGRRDHVGLHAGGRVDGNDVRTRLAQPTRDVAAAGGDVEHVHAGAWPAPRHDEVEVVAGGVRGALAVGPSTFVPEVRHAASSTARRAPSSIVASGWMFSRPASARICRPSAAFVPSSRTTIG